MDRRLVLATLAATSLLGGSLAARPLDSAQAQGPGAQAPAAQPAGTPTPEPSHSPGVPPATADFTRMDLVSWAGPIAPPVEAEFDSFGRGR
jgi:hypothetical protein